MPWVDIRIRCPVRQAGVPVGRTFLDGFAHGGGTFAGESFAWVHIDARHDYISVRAGIAAWVPKIQRGGWLSGDDYHEEQWPGVVRAVTDALPDAQRWCSTQRRWIKPIER